ncbi:MAG: hypothetical protein AB7O88_28490 [Reyranellaceae bacterium]
MDTLANAIADTLETELAKAEFPGPADNIVPLRPAQRDPDSEIERACAAHRRLVAARSDRIALTRRETKAAMTRLADARDAELARHEQALGSIEAEEAATQARARAAIATDRRLIAASRAALTLLEGEE